MDEDNLRNIHGMCDVCLIPVYESHVEHATLIRDSQLWQAIALSNYTMAVRSTDHASFVLYDGSKLSDRANKSVH